MSVPFIDLRGFAAGQDKLLSTWCGVLFRMTLGYIPCSLTGTVTNIFRGPASLLRFHLCQDFEFVKTL